MSDTKYYVVGFLREKATGDVIFIRKQKPQWQKGRLNGVGGKIEQGETPLQAMAREFHEEVGFEHREWRQFALLTDRTPSDNRSVVYCFAAEVDEFPGWPDQDLPRRVTDVGEGIELHDPLKIPGRLDIIPNLAWLVPLAFFDQDAPVVVAQAA
jgi:8-oxo-dGTP diphosphatase